jgi:hypothetical protein
MKRDQQIYIQKRIERARWLLDNARFAAMATVNDDGSPQNTPYLFMKSDDLRELYWGSNPKSRHSQNVARTGQIFVVLYEANEKGGLYIRCQNARVAEGPELERALAAHNRTRKNFALGDPLNIEYYQQSEQRMYIADVVELTVNYSEKYENGLTREDKRHEVSREELTV